MEEKHTQYTQDKVTTLPRVKRSTVPTKQTAAK